MELTSHWDKRRIRNDFIKNVIGIGHPIRIFRCDKNHRDGPELHTITDTGIVIIRNEITDKLITALIARPGQIYKYYMNENEYPPDFLIDIAVKHSNEGYNHI